MGLLPFCEQLILRAENGEDPVEIARNARKNVLKLWDSIDTNGVEERLTKAQNGAFKAGINSVEREVRDTPIAAARVAKGPCRAKKLPCKWIHELKLLTIADGETQLKKTYTVKDRYGHKIVFGKLTRKHMIYDKRKDREDRMRDVLFAYDTAQNGQRSVDKKYDGSAGEKRWNYTKEYEVEDSSFQMKVTCIERKNGDLDVLTYSRTKPKK